MGDQHLNKNPVYGTVRLSRLDEDAWKQAQDLLARSIKFAAEVTGNGDGFQIGRLAEAIAAEMVAELAPKGLALEKLCESKQLSDGRIREFFGEELRGLIDVAVRALLPLTNRTAIHQYLRTEPVRVGKESHAIGIDHEKGAPHIAYILVCSLGCCDRNLINQADWLLTDTHDDRTSARADWARIKGFEAELGYVLPGSLEQHLEGMFDAEARAQQRVAQAANARHSAFYRAGIDPQRFERFCFPKCVILDRMPLGRPRVGPTRAFSREVFPGDEPSVIEAVEAAGKYGIARCQLQEPEVNAEYSALEDTLLPALSERLGEAPEPIAPRRLNAVAEWSLANLLGVGANIRQVRIWRFPKSECLLRAMQASDDGGEFIDADLWRTIRLSEEEALRAAFALVERAQQVWPISCISRYRKECEPGMVMASSARARTGLLRSSLLASAAGASAHREMEIRRLGEQR